MDSYIKTSAVYSILEELLFTDDIIFTKRKEKDKGNGLKENKISHIISIWNTVFILSTLKGWTKHL